MNYEFGKIERLSESLKLNKVPQHEYEAIMKDGELIKKTSKNKVKAQWFYNAVNTMDKLLDHNLKQKIREDCACCLGGKRAALCRTVNKDYAAVEERIKAINDTHFVFGNEIKIIAPGKYEVSFFDKTLSEKKCVCIKELDTAMPITYCMCCGGHVKHHLQTVLGVPLKVEVASSALSSKGKENCVFHLTEK